jgi:hypothetical protein
MMNSQEISDAVWTYAKGRSDFTAPYGVLQGEHVNKKGAKYKSVTFGRARSLDATVEIYNRNFMILRCSGDADRVYKNYHDLMVALQEL